MVKGPLISSQRYLDQNKVLDKINRFKVFIVYIYPVILKGKQYTILMDGHHNYRAAKELGVNPEFRMVKGKALRLLNRMIAEERERMLINNLTDSDYYNVETGEVIEDLLLPMWGN